MSWNISNPIKRAHSIYLEYHFLLKSQSDAFSNCYICTLYSWVSFQPPQTNKYIFIHTVREHWCTVFPSHCLPSKVNLWPSHRETSENWITAHGAQFLHCYVVFMDSFKCSQTSGNWRDHRNMLQMLKVATPNFASQTTVGDALLTERLKHLYHFSCISLNSM